MEKTEVILIDQKQMAELEMIIIDRDQAAAFRFLKEYIYNPIKMKREAHCKPPI